MSRRAAVEQMSLGLNVPLGPLPNGPPAVTTSDTSVAAAASVAPVVGRLQARVLEVVRNAGTHGITCDAVEAVMEGRHQTVSARVRELVLKGLIEDSGERRQTRSGRNARVYVAANRAQR